jgi:magnesium transporter
MTPDYVAARPEWRVGETLAHVRAKGKDCETINVVYFTHNRWKLIGVLGLRRLILTLPIARIGKIMEESAVRISAFEDRENAVQLISRYDITALSVVDADGNLRFSCWMAVMLIASSGGVVPGDKTVRKMR